MSPNRPIYPGEEKTRASSFLSIRRRPRRNHASRHVAAFLLLIAVSGVLAAQGTYHILQKGETLYGIAKKYDVPYAALIAYNDIKEPTKVRIGQKLIIPAFHRVLKGETLYGISREYGLSVEELRSVNKLQPQDIIKPDDLLAVTGSGGIVPGPVKTAASTPAVSHAPANSGNAPSSAAASANAPATAGPMLPPTVRTSARIVDKKISWPCPGEAVYLDGKLFGIMIRSKAGETEKAVAAGTVVSAGPYRGFGHVAFVQSRSGHIYVYGGNESLAVRIGDPVRVGQSLGNVGIDPKDGGAVAWFFVFRNGEALDPALAPRDM
jgi:lipoprotein YgeR